MNTSHEGLRLHSGTKASFSSLHHLTLGRLYFILKWPELGLLGSGLIFTVAISRQEVVRIPLQPDPEKAALFPEAPDDEDTLILRPESGLDFSFSSSAGGDQTYQGGRTGSK